MRPHNDLFRPLKTALLEPPSVRFLPHRGRRLAQKCGDIRWFDEPGPNGMGGAMIGAEAPLILGSASPRRAEILETLGVPFRVVKAAVDEASVSGESPANYVERIVEAKAAALLHVLSNEPWEVSLVADTVVALGPHILGKPTDALQAAQMLGFLDGQTHTVLTRYRIDLNGGPSVSNTVTTAVTFRKLARDEIDDYAACGEGWDKAGAYAVQGKAAAFVETLQGSYSGVVGLPACQLIADLRALGVWGAPVPRFD